MLAVSSFTLAGAVICYQHLTSRQSVNATVVEHFERDDDGYLDDPITYPRQYVVDPAHLEWARDYFPEGSVRRLERLPDAEVHHLYVVAYALGEEEIRAPLVENRHAGVRALGDEVKLMVNPKDPRFPISGSLMGNLAFAVFGLPVGGILLFGGCVMIYRSLS
jgi:hypothetical protein